MNKKYKIKTKEQIKESVKNIMTWDFENGGGEHLEQITDAICRGKSVVIDAVSYIGNGKYVKESEKGRYQYKLIVPIMDRNNNLYSTDLFKDSPEYAKNGKYGIYYKTRQLVVDVLEEIETDYRNERFDFGYRLENGDKYGQFIVKCSNR